MKAKAMKRSMKMKKAAKKSRKMKKRVSKVLVPYLQVRLYLFGETLFFVIDVSSSLVYCRYFYVSSILVYVSRRPRLSLCE